MVAPETYDTAIESISFALFTSSRFRLNCLFVNIESKIPRSVVEPVRCVVLIVKFDMLAVRPFCNPIANSISDNSASVSDNVSR